MKVYCTPIKLNCTSGRYTASAFFLDNAKKNTTEMDYSDSDKSIYFRFFEDVDTYVCVILTIKKSKNYVSAKQHKKSFSLKMNKLGNEPISEANVFIIKKNNLKGIYVHNEGSMLLSGLDSKLRSHYNNSLRKKLKTKKRDEKFVIERIVDNSSLLDKIKKYSFVDEINATFVNSTIASRLLNSSVYKKTKTVRITMRTNNLSIKTKKAKDELVDYLNVLISENGKNISFKGRESVRSAGDTVGIIDKANSIKTIEHDYYLDLLNGIELSGFLKEGIFTELKEVVMTHELLK
ncbi:hypothetical protein [Providencia stuartii]|uniref:hypothetical protein n=1 Tax=Providencia stuartii TaxID=588 RepID=UPI00331D6421